MSSPANARASVIDSASRVSSIVRSGARFSRRPPESDRRDVSFLGPREGVVALAHVEDVNGYSARPLQVPSRSVR